MRTGKVLRDEPRSDLQRRLRFIEEEADGIRSTVSGTSGMCIREDQLASLADHVSYLARILEKHLADGEV